MDYSSAFNTILPDRLHTKLLQLHVPSPICEWITDFLTNRKQQVRAGSHLSAPLITNTGAPHGCVLSPYLFSLYTNDCLSSHSSIKLVKFADDTTVLGLIKDADETAGTRCHIWQCGVHATTWSSTPTRRWRWSWTSGDTYPPTPYFLSTAPQFRW